MRFVNLRRGGFTLVEIMIVVAIIGLLCAVSIPGFVRARENSRTKICINNLRQIDGAVDQYALEWGRATADPVPTGTLDGVTPGYYNYLKREPLCPVGQNSVYGNQVVGTPATCPNNLPGHVFP